MTSESEDIMETCEYVHSHDSARGMLPLTAGAMVLGSFLIVSHDGSQSGIEDLLLGGVIVAASLAGLAIAVYAMRRPKVAHIVLSPQGVLFRDVSTAPCAFTDSIQWYAHSGLACHGIIIARSDSVVRAGEIDAEAAECRCLDAEFDTSAHATRSRLL